MSKRPVIRFNFLGASGCSEDEKNKIRDVVLKLGWIDGERSYHLSATNDPNPYRSTSMFSFMWMHDSEPVYPEGLNYDKE